MNPKKILTEQEEIFLFKVYTQSVEANNQIQINCIQSILIKANQGLVYSVARKHLNRKLELEDLIQEVNMWLLKAISKFEPLKEIDLLHMPFNGFSNLLNKYMSLKLILIVN